VCQFFPVLLSEFGCVQEIHRFEIITEWVVTENRKDGPTLLAGHSYGGQIMTALGSDAPNAVGLVYVAAFGLDEGESIGALLPAHQLRLWRTWTSTSGASPGYPRRTSSITSPPTSIQSKREACSRSSSRWQAPLLGR
jgi:pimeloyl-ACP methyl ester carboxylesterase